MVSPDQNDCRMRFRYFLRLQYISHPPHILFGTIATLGVTYVTEVALLFVFCEPGFD